MPAIVISVVLCSLLVMSCIASIRAFLDAAPYVRALARSVRAGFVAADAHSKIEAELAEYVRKTRSRRGIL
jgi:hypothetical protein